MLLFLILNFMATINALFLERRFFPASRPAERALGIFNLYFGQIVLVVIILGTLSLLRPVPVTIFVSATFVLILFTIGRKYPIDFSLTTILNRCQVPVSNFLALTIILTAGLLISYYMTLRPFPPFGTDSLIYHLRFPAEWVKSGRIQTPPVFFGDPSPSYYPLNAEFFFYWLLFPLKNDFFARYGQMIFLPLATLALFCVITRLDIGRKSALYACLLFAVSRPFVQESVNAYNDLVLLYFFLCTLNYLLSIKAEQKQKTIFLASISWGLFLGTKYTALIYSLPLLLVAIIPRLLQKKKITREEVGRRSSSKTGFFFALLLFFALSSYSYLRNFFLTGNPVYPADLKIFGFTLYSGLFDAGLISNKSNIWQLLRSFSSQYQFSLPPLLGIFLGFSFVGSIVRFFLRGRLRKEPVKLVFLVLPALTFYLFAVLSPRHDMRLFFPVYGLLFINLAYIMELLPEKNYLKRAICLGAILLSGAHNLHYFPFLLMRAVLIAALLYVFFIYLKKNVLIKPEAVMKSLKENKFFISLIGIILFAGLISGLIINNIYYTKSKYNFYVRAWPQQAAGWRWLDANTRKKGSCVAYTGTDIVYPLFGAFLQNKVLYISIDEPSGKMIHQYDAHYSQESGFTSESFKETYRSHPRFAHWWQQLKEKEVDYLFITSRDEIEQESVEKEWARLNPESFEKIFESGRTTIYRVHIEGKTSLR